MDTQSLVNNPQANIALTVPVEQHVTNWFPISGATNHSTNASQSFYPACVPYTCQGKVVVCNGSTLNSSVIDYTAICTNYPQLPLHNMLYTRCLTKNFLSVSQLAKDNKVYL